MSVPSSDSDVESGLRYCGDYLCRIRRRVPGCRLRFRASLTDTNKLVSLFGAFCEWY